MATYYWVGGTGSWSDATHWATSSGGAGNKGVPTSADDVIFDQNSSVTTMSVYFTSSTSSVRNLTLTNFVSRQTVFVSDFPSYTLYVYGSFTNNTSGAFLFSPTAAPRLYFQSNAVTGRVCKIDGQIYSSVTFNASTGYPITIYGYLYCDYLSTNNYSGKLYVIAGTVLCDSTAIARAQILFSMTNNAQFYLYSTTFAVLSVGYEFSVVDTAVFQANSGTISFSGHPDSGSAYYGQVKFTISVPANSVFYRAIINATANSFYPTDGIKYFDGCNSLTITADTASSTKAFNVASNLSVTTLTVTSTSAVCRVLLYGNSAAPATISATTVTATNTDFKDIVVNATTVNQTFCGNWGNVTGVTFDAPKTCYYIDGDFDSTSFCGFALTSGGTQTYAAFPLGQDTVVFDANSTGASCTYVAMRAIYALDVSALVVDSAIDTPQNAYLYIRESFTGSPKFTLDVTVATGPDSFTCDASGSVMGALLCADATLASDLTLTGALYPSGSSFISAGYNITADQILTGASTVLQLGSSTVTTTNQYAPVQISSASMSAAAATFVISPAAAGSPNVTFAGNRVKEIVLDDNCTGILFNDALNVGKLSRSATATVAMTMQFKQSVTHNVDRWEVSGQPTRLVTVKSLVNGTQFTIQKPDTIPVSADYLSVQDSAALPATNVWYAGANSTDGGNNSGWVFSAAPSGGLFMFF